MRRVRIVVHFEKTAPLVWNMPGRLVGLVLNYGKGMAEYRRSLLEWSMYETGDLFEQNA